MFGILLFAGEWEDRVDVFLQVARRTLLIWGASLASIAVLFYRVLQADSQVTWDEELYFQIATTWSNDFIPYRDIFDHKPPFLYVYYWIFSFFGESMAVLRDFQALFLLSTIALCYFILKDKISVVFVPLLFAVLSVYGLQGTNTEIIYIPFLLLLLCSLLREWKFSAATFISLAVLVKYTVALDVLGILIAATIIQKKPPSLQVIAIASAMSMVISAVSYAYFIAHDVNIVYETIIRNMQHASGERSISFPGYFRRIGVFLCIAIVGAKVLQKLFFKKKMTSNQDAAGESAFIVAMIAWFVLSILQAEFTGKGYYHYFAPTYLPLTLLASFFVKKIETGYIDYMIFSILALFGIFLTFSAFDKKSDIEVEKSRLLSICGNGDFHYHGQFLMVYRLCNVKPLKYMFHPFYSVQHFVNVSNSGGKDWIKSVDRKIVYDDGKVIEWFDNGQSFVNSDLPIFDQIRR
jgi:hypothetical protein